MSWLGQSCFQHDEFRMVEDVGAAAVVPMHYDVFAPSSSCVYPEEIEVVCERSRSAVRVDLDPDSV